MFANYGRQGDLRVLQDSRVGLEGSVVLLRAGNISFAEQVGVDLTVSGIEEYNSCIIFVTKCVPGG